jgi:radical SAM superfamily enzyme YgiQ (UPF0313 family)
MPPFTLAYIKNILRKSTRCTLLDASAEKLTLAKTISHIKKNKTQFLIITTVTPTIENDCNWFAGAVRKAVPSIKIAVFGTHVSALPAETLKAYPAIDLVIKGEPEAVIHRLVAALIKKQSLRSVPGICYRAGNDIINNPLPVPQNNIDAYGLADWSDINIKNYTLPLINKPFLIISVERGCPYACDFCTTSFYYGKKLRYRSPQSIIAEMRQNLKLGVHDFLLWADTINADPRWFESLLDKIINSGLNEKIRWVCAARIDNMSEKILIKLKKAGCWQVAFGIEFGSNESLAAVSKGGSHTTELARKTITQAQAQGILTDGHFILGYPGETAQDVSKTIDFACSLPLAFAQFYTPVPFPGSRWFNILPKDNLLWDKFTQHDYIYKNSHSSTIHRRVKQAYLRFYLNPRRMLNLLRFTLKHGRVLSLIPTGFSFLLHTLFVKGSKTHA